MQRSFWSNWFKPASASSRKWTLEELGELYDVLLRNGVVTESNRAVVVETIRTIAEYILWGDQNEPRIFDFFLENNILTYLHKVLLQPANRTGEVAKQVLQTLSIIIQNVRSETGIFFLFSNNHINNIVDLDFDFSDEEVLGYYVSFLKTISLKLNAGTVLFFLNSSSTGKGFPLYTRAIRLAHNREGMVRAAVRTLTLNVCSVPDPDITSFVTAPPASHYFTEVAQYMADQVQLLDRHLMSAEGGGAQALGSLDSQLAEVEDVLAYISDLLSLGVPALSHKLASSLWQCLVRPLLLRPLMQPPPPHASAAAAAAAAAAARGLHRSSSSRAAAGTSPPVGSPKPANMGHVGHWSWGSGSVAQQDAARQPGQARVQPECAVFVLERLFLLLSYQPLLQQLILALTCPKQQHQQYLSPAAPNNITSSTSSSSNSTSHPLDGSSSSSKCADTGSGTSSSSSSSCRECLLGMLTGGQPLQVLLVLRLLVAVVNCRHLPPELLSLLSILPRKQLHQATASINVAGGSSLEVVLQVLSQQLQVAAQSNAAGHVDGSTVSAPAAAAAQSAAAAAAAGGDTVHQEGLQVDLQLLLTEQYLPTVQQGSTGVESAAAGAAAGSAASSDAGSDGCDSSRVQHYLDLLDCWPSSQQQQQQQGSGPDATAAPAAAGADASFSGFGLQLLSCLMPLLQLPAVPPLGLWLLGWLLHQLLPVSAVTGAVTADDGSPAAAAAAAGRHRLSSSLGGCTDSFNDLRLNPINNSSRAHSRSSSMSSSIDEANTAGRDRSSSTGGLDLQQHSSCTAEAGLDTAGAPPLSTTRAISVQSSLGFEPRASVLDAVQQQQLQAALQAAHAGFTQQLSSMWCEAVFPLLAVEWPAARDMLLRPVLRASSADLLSGLGAWPVLRVLQQQRQQQQQGSRTEGHSASAQAALECYLAVQRVVALTQIQELLRVGYVACSPPVPAVSESDLKQVDIQEGFQVDLAPGSALPCVVSFAPGQERRVYFAVAGLSKQQMAALQGSPSSTSPQRHPGHPASPSSTNTFNPNPTAPHTLPLGGLSGAGGGGVSGDVSRGGGAAGHASLLRSLPVAVLADPAPSRPQSGVVLSVAPLLGARPYTDPQVGKWLHVHVRPSVRGLLRIIKTASTKKGGLLSAMRQLADGHWVLAFSSGDKAALAVTLIGQHAARLQGLYGDALAPLCEAAQQQAQDTQLQQQQQQREEEEQPRQGEQEQGTQQQQQEQQQQEEQQRQEDAAAVAVAQQQQQEEDVKVSQEERSGQQQQQQQQEDNSSHFLPQHVEQMHHQQRQQQQQHGEGQDSLQQQEPPQQQSQEQPGALGDLSGPLLPPEQSALQPGQQQDTLWPATASGTYPDLQEQQQHTQQQTQQQQQEQIQQHQEPLPMQPDQALDHSEQQQ